MTKLGAKSMPGQSFRDKLWSLEFKRFRLSRTKTKNLECKFSDSMHEVGVEVRLDAQVVPKGGCFKYMGSR